MDNQEKLEAGFYHLTSQDEPEPLLAHAYYSNDSKSFGFGFNTHDGGGFLPLNDLSEDTVVTKVLITEVNND